MSPAQLVNDRRQLLEFYEGVCTRTYSRLTGDQRLEPEQNLLKSYLIEAHPNGASDRHAAKLQLLKQASTRIKAETSATDDPTLFNIRRGNDVFHCDALNDRFWIFHSTAPVQTADRFIHDLTRGTARFDFTWFSGDRMEEIAASGQFLGFTSEHDPRPLLAEEGEEPAGRNRGLVVNVRRFMGDATETLAKLRRADMFRGELSLNSIRVRFGERANFGFALDEVTNHGKFTARGPSFSAHQALITRSLDQYQTTVASLEDALAIRWDRAAEGARFSGSPIGIGFEPTTSFELLVATMFNGKRPFRLWGVPVMSGATRYTVTAVDLHVGSLLQIELVDGLMRVYLPEESCGNTITRLYTNIQQHIDAQAVLYVGDRARQFGSAS